MSDAPLSPLLPPSEVELIKASSRHLRGSLEQSLSDALTGAIAADDTHVSKFHGIYQQDDRDIRSERKRQKLEPAYSFMIRARIPGGVLTTEQWLQLSRIATDHANDTIRLTTRQAIQFHGVIKTNLKSSIIAINESMLDTIAACGDVNRNVMAPPLPPLSKIHRKVQAHAIELSSRLTPATNAYHEIWLDGEKLEDDTGKVEPIYGDTYLPRKFKTAFVVPPRNDTDVFAQDLGYIAVVERGRLVGYNVTVGGGMGMTHGESATYPRLGDVLGFCLPEQVIEVAEAVVTVQRDFGDRSNRKHARLKYTLDDHGLEWFRDEVEQRLTFSLEVARPFAFAGNGDVYGWQEDDQGAWHYTLFVENGRVGDFGNKQLKSGLENIAAVHTGEFRLTPNQNLIISGVATRKKAEIADLLSRHGIENNEQATQLRLNSMACVAFPTCALAMAESERYLPTLIDKLDEIAAANGLSGDAITIRMTGCPNGCARPYVAEIGLVGKGPGTYNLYLGAGFSGDRLGRLYLDNANEVQIIEVLTPLFAAYATNRQPEERFGNYLVRSGVIRAVSAGRFFHEAGRDE